MNDKQMTWEAAVCWLRDDPGNQELVWQCYYDDPIDQAAERFFMSEEWRDVKTLLPVEKTLSVLDIGAGRGISSYAFAKMGFLVTALEPDGSKIVGAGAIRELIERSGVTITIVEERGESLPFPDDSFDVVYGRAVCHHADNLQKFCAEAERVLKPGGTFLMTREHVISRKLDLQTFLDSHPLHHLYGGENAYLLSDYVQAINSSGLRDVKIIRSFESAINYAPTTSEELQKMIVRPYKRLFGRKFAERLAAWDVFVSWRKRRLSLKDDAPGRLYTFKATK